MAHRWAGFRRVWSSLPLPAHLLWALQLCPDGVGVGVGVGDDLIAVFAGPPPEVLNMTAITMIIMRNSTTIMAINPALLFRFSLSFLTLIFFDCLWKVALCKKKDGRNMRYGLRRLPRWELKFQIPNIWESDGRTRVELTELRSFSERSSRSVSFSPRSSILFTFSTINTFTSSTPSWTSCSLSVYGAQWSITVGNFSHKSSKRHFNHGPLHFVLQISGICKKHQTLLYFYTGKTCKNICFESKCYRYFKISWRHHSVRFA